MDLIDGALIWKMKATYGMPLDLILSICSKRGLIPTWMEFFEAAADDGVKLSRLAREVNFMVWESYDGETASEISSRLGECIRRVMIKKTEEYARLADSKAKRSTDSN